MVYNTTQTHPPPPPPATYRHTLSVYTVLYVYFGKGGGVREKVEGQHSTQVLLLRPWGQQFTSWVENHNQE
jgi:hypothetical protein